VLRLTYRFSFSIDNVGDRVYFETCNLRLTNATTDNIISNYYRTNYSDPIFFRVKNNNSITINDKSFYLAHDNYNINNGFIDINIFLDWDSKTALLLYNNTYIDYMLSLGDHITQFYHNSLNINETMPNKVLLYNLYPNTSCVVKNLELCEDYCDAGNKIVNIRK
jgi:hypothetical protein